MASKRKGGGKYAGLLNEYGSSKRKGGRAKGWDTLGRTPREHIMDEAQMSRAIVRETENTMVSFDEHMRPQGIMRYKAKDPKKRQMTLADAYAHHRYTAHDPLVGSVPIATQEKIQAKVRTATKFSFDDEASERLGDVVRDVPDLIVREARFARPPYGVTWIEINASVYWRTIYRGNNAKLALAAPDHAERVGYLIDGDTAFCVAGGTADEPGRLHLCHTSPFRYWLHGEDMWNTVPFPNMTPEQALDNAGPFLWGSTADQIGRDELREITRMFSFGHLWPIKDMPSHEFQQAQMAENVGDLRTLVAILLMLNRPKICRYKETLPTHKTFIRGKRGSYFSHTTIAIDLNPIPQLHLIGKRGDDPDDRRARHPVRGHYCHDHVSREYQQIAGCLHDYVSATADWTPCPDAPAREVTHWICSQCGGKRWWRADHERGTAEVGFNIPDYAVTSSS